MKLKRLFKRMHSQFILQMIQILRTMRSVKLRIQRNSREGLKRVDIVVQQKGRELVRCNVLAVISKVTVVAVVAM